jgi:hypothetical protein
MLTPKKIATPREAVKGSAIFLFAVVLLPIGDGREALGVDRLLGVGSRRFQETIDQFSVPRRLQGVGNLPWSLVILYGVVLDIELARHGNLKVKPIVLGTRAVPKDGGGVRLADECLEGLHAPYLGVNENTHPVAWGGSHRGGFFKLQGFIDKR